MATVRLLVPGTQGAQRHADYYWQTRVTKQMGYIIWLCHDRDVICRGSCDLFGCVVSAYILRLYSYVPARNERRSVRLGTILSTLGKS